MIETRNKMLFIELWPWHLKIARVRAIDAKISHGVGLLHNGLME